jgi:uncharacterized protein (DUF1499 family)
MNQTSGTAAQKLPALVNWLGLLALTLLVMLPVAVVTVRSGAWQQGLLLYAIGCFGAAILLLLAIVLMLLPRYASWRKALAGRALLAVPGTLLLLSLLAGGDRPRIHDISTDLQDPPVFTAAQQQRGSGSNSLDTAPETRALQAAAYPEVQTLRSALEYQVIFDKAVRVAMELGWEIYRQDRNAGVIEAVDTTAIMGFKDDIVIRVRTGADGSLVDLRSVSRVGLGDLGANARRINSFIERMQQE